MADTENFYQDLLESLQDLIVEFSPEGRLLYVNSAYCNMLGKPGRIWWAVFYAGYPVNAIPMSSPRR